MEQSLCKLLSILKISTGKEIPVAPFPESKLEPIFFKRNLNTLFCA